MADKDKYDAGYDQDENLLYADGYEEYEEYPNEFDEIEGVDESEGSGGVPIRGFAMIILAVAVILIVMGVWSFVNIDGADDDKDNQAQTSQNTAVQGTGGQKPGVAQNQQGVQNGQAQGAQNAQGQNNQADQQAQQDQAARDAAQQAQQNQGQQDGQNGQAQDGQNAPGQNNQADQQAQQDQAARDAAQQAQRNQQNQENQAANQATQQAQQNQAAQPAAANHSVPVMVYNNGTVPGNAKANADRLSAANWQNVNSGNLRGSTARYEQSVVLYPEGKQAEGEAVARQLGLTAQPKSSADNQQLSRSSSDAVVVVLTD